MFQNVPFIYSYTRAQAIADGELVDVTEAAKHVGFKIPVAVTKAAYHVGVTEPNAHDNIMGDASESQSLAGFLDMIHWLISRSLDNERMAFNFGIGGKKSTFVVVCGPGDDAEPVITIHLPGED